MEHFEKALVRLGEYVKSMTPQARLWGAASLVLVVAGVIWLLAQGPSAADTYLMGGESFSATQLRDMVGAFGKAGLDDYQIDGAKVRVPGGQQSKYMAALADVGALPEDFGQYLQKAVNASGFMLSGPRQEAQTKVAIQSELQLVISRMKGIESAFVHIAEETSQGFPRTKTVTASVGLQPRDEQAVDDATVAAIRSLLAGAWPGLKPAAVTVVDLSGNRLFAGTTDPTAHPAKPPEDYAAWKRQLERDSQEKIARAVAIPGALVTADVQLDPEQRRPHRVAVSVAVPQAYYEEIWRKQHAPPGRSANARPDSAALAAIEQSEARKIRAAILPLLGPAGPAAGESQIAVSTIHAPAPAAVPEAADPLRTWLVQNWHLLSLAGLIVAGLVVLHATIKTVPQRVGTDLERSGEGASPLFEGGDMAAEPVMAALTTNQRQLAVSGESLRAELAEMVHQRPQTAASVLKNWIGNAT